MAKWHLLIAFLVVLTALGLGYGAWMSTPLNQSLNCTVSSEPHFAGKAGPDGTLVALFEPGFLGDTEVENGCTVLGDQLLVYYYTPTTSAPIPVTVVQYVTVPVSATERVGNATVTTVTWQPRDIEWANSSIPAAPQARGSLTISLPSTAAVMNLTVSFEGVSWQLAHVTPPTSFQLITTSAIIPEAFIEGGVVAFFALLVAALLSEAASKRMMYVPPLRRAWVLLLVGGGTVSPIVWLASWRQLSLAVGGVSMYLFVLIPEALIFFLALLPRWRPAASKVQFDQLEGTEDEYQPARRAPIYRIVFGVGGKNYIVDGGYVAALLRLLLGPRGASRFDDRALAAHPIRFRITDRRGGAADYSYVVPTGRALPEYVEPHLEWFKRDPLTPEETAAGRKKGRLHLAKLVAPDWAPAVVGTNAAIDILSHVAGERHVADVAADYQVLENQVTELEASVDTKAAKRGRELVRYYLEAGREAVGEPEADVSQALLEAVQYLATQNGHKEIFDKWLQQTGRKTTGGPE